MITASKSICSISQIWQLYCYQGLWALEHDNARFPNYLLLTIIKTYYRGISHISWLCGHIHALKCILNLYRTGSQTQLKLQDHFLSSNHILYNTSKQVLLCRSLKNNSKFTCCKQVNKFFYRLTVSQNSKNKMTKRENLLGMYLSSCYSCINSLQFLFLQFHLLLCNNNNKGFVLLFSISIHPYAHRILGIN